MKSLIFKEDYEIIIDFYSSMRKGVKNRQITRELNHREISNLQREIAKEKGLESFKRPEIPEKDRFITEDEYYKVLFKRGDKFEPNNTISILVGDNGCGKSTLLKLFKKENKNSKILFVDMEKANPKITKPRPENIMDGYSIPEVLNMFSLNDESHGETRQGVLVSLLDNIQDYDMLIFDEPEQGLSLINQYKYFLILKEISKNKPIIIATHSKVFIENMDRIFDVETMSWTDSKDYLINIKNKIN